MKDSSSRRSIARTFRSARRPVMSRGVRLVRNNLRQQQRSYIRHGCTTVVTKPDTVMSGFSLREVTRGPGGLKINSASGAQIRAWHKSSGSGGALGSPLRSEHRHLIHLGLPPYYTRHQFRRGTSSSSLLHAYLLHKTARRQIGRASFPRAYVLP